jgi:hypothetical protein
MMATLEKLAGGFGAAMLVTIAACGGGGDGSDFASGAGATAGKSDGSSGGASSGFGKGAANAPPASTDCTGLQCKQVACAGGGTTSLSGKVFDPSGTVPLYNAIVYVPNADLAPFADGVTCDQCGTVPSGKPIATALTDSKGDFVLKDVPAGVDFPLVVQIGRWRRKVMVPAVAQCTDTPIGADYTRLPRSKAEGEIPKIAIATGGADSLECFVRKLGVESEMTNPDGAGRVHLYQGKRSGQDGARIDASTPAGNVLWDDAAKLKSYDIVILSCEGAENNDTKSSAARDNIKSYLDAGGRLFASHFHYTWFKNGASPLDTTAKWGSDSGSEGSRDVSADTSFAKGQAFAEWLGAVGATKAPGVVAMTDLKSSITGVPAKGASADTSRRWLYTNSAPKFYSFNTPIGTAPAQQCGRGVYTDIHVSSGDASGGTFPGNCTTSGFTAQEKALLFLMMDLASCIQDDSKPPTAPPASTPVK